MDLKDLRITMENLPILLEVLRADPEWVANLTEEEKQAIIDKGNRLIVERFRN